MRIKPFVTRRILIALLKSRLINVKIPVLYVAEEAGLEPARAYARTLSKRMP